MKQIEAPQEATVSPDCLRTSDGTWFVRCAKVKGKYTYSIFPGSPGEPSRARTTSNIYHNNRNSTFTHYINYNNYTT